MNVSEVNFCQGTFYSWLRSSPFTLVNENKTSRCLRPTWEFKKILVKTGLDFLTNTFGIKKEYHNDKEKRTKCYHRRAHHNRFVAKMLTTQVHITTILFKRVTDGQVGLGDSAAF